VDPQTRNRIDMAIAASRVLGTTWRQWNAIECGVGHGAARRGRVAVASKRESKVASTFASRAESRIASNVAIESNVAIA